MRLTVSVNEAADMLGVGTRDVRRKLRNGDLHAVRTCAGKRVLVSLDSLLAALGYPEEERRRVLLACLDQASSNASRSSSASHGPRAVGRPPAMHRPLEGETTPPPAGHGTTGRDNRRRESPASTNRRRPSPARRRLEVAIADRIDRACAAGEARLRRESELNCGVASLGE